MQPFTTLCTVLFLLSTAARVLALSSSLSSLHDAPSAMGDDSGSPEVCSASGANSCEPRAELSVATIDISPLYFSSSSSAAARQSVVDQMAHSARTLGFFNVIVPHIMTPTHSAYIDLMATFFHLSKEEKSEVHRSATNARGWADNELTKQLLDEKELFDFGARALPVSSSIEVVDAATAPYNDGTNQFLSTDKLSMEDVSIAFYDEMTQVCHLLIHALAEGLNLNATYFDDIINPSIHSSYMRMNYYPPAAPAASDTKGGSSQDAANDDLATESHLLSLSKLGVSRHTDAGVLTLLYQDPTISSLQVYSGTKQDNNDGEWVDVPPSEKGSGGFTVNIGDMLKVMSNDLYKAPEHRVLRSPNGRERFSSPFFYNPSFDAVIRPFAEKEEEEGVEEGKGDRGRKYRDFTWRMFREARFNGDFADVGKETQIEDFLL
jgi:isopenicillin N synthase-like dioxygenase